MAVGVCTPRPRTLSVRPCGVPAGTRTRTVEPSRVGTSTSVPSTASGQVIGTLTVRWQPSRPNTGWAATLTTA